MGVPRSGTTLVAGRLCGIGNSCYLPKSLRVLERFGLGSCFGIAKGMASLSGNLSCLGASWGKHDGGGQFWAMFGSIKDREKRRALLLSATYPEASSDRVFINKRIENVNQLDLLAQTFPEAALIHVKRNPLDTVKSILTRRQVELGSVDKRWGVFTEDMPEKNEDPIVDSAFQYRKIYELIERKKHLFAECLSVTYEDFCSNPEKELDRLLTRLSLDAATLNYMGIACRNKEHKPDFAKKVTDVLSESSSKTLVDATKNLVRYSDA